ncbi:MAG: alpha/beta hydrolase, partial [Ferruginibacter sp.]
AWHHKEGSPHFLRDSQPNAQIASIRLAELIEHFAAVAKGLPEKPIVIGHSIGGLLTQILVNRGLAAAGIAIHSLAPQGIIPTQFSFYKSTWRALGFFTSIRKSYLMSFKKWQYAFTNDMSLAEQEEGYERFLIPESKLALRDGLTSVAKVDFKKPHAPLLFLAGSADHCIPAALNLSNMKKYKDRSSVTDYIVLKGRNHFVLGQSSWRGDADCILSGSNQ